MFRIFSALCLASVLSVVSVMAIAARPVSETERAEAEAICHKSPSSEYYNCSCVGNHVAENAAARGEPANMNLLAPAAFKACPQNDKTVLAASAFKKCDLYFTSRRTDHAAFCQCVGDDVAREFTSAPEIGANHRDMLLRNAYTRCGVNDESTRVKDMKTPVASGSAAFEKVRAEQEASCRLNLELDTWVNCACVGRKMAEDAAIAGESRPLQAQRLALETCPQDDKAPIEKRVFDSCDSYMVTVRTDHEAFCRCAAQKTAAAFLAKPQFNLRYRELLRRQAMDACGIADTSTKIKN